MLFPSLILSIDHETQIANKNKSINYNQKVRQDSFLILIKKGCIKKRELVLCKFHILYYLDIYITYIKIILQIDRHEVPVFIIKYNFIHYTKNNRYGKKEIYISFLLYYSIGSDRILSILVRSFHLRHQIGIILPFLFNL